MADIQTFPIMWEDFVKTYEFRDKEELYTNGAMLIPSFRVEQMVKHYFAEPMSRPNVVRCKDCKYLETIAVSYSDKLLFVCIAEWCIGSEGDHPLVEPDGFCAWGERKEVSE